MIAWAVANQKGGVGKTTTTVSLGGLQAKRGGRALLVDLDPHGSLTSYFGYDPEEGVPGVYTLFQRRIEGKTLTPRDIVQSTQVEGLDLLCASTALATLDRQLGNREGMGLVLAQTLKALESDYDYVLMDCPPMLGVLMVNALAACEHLLIPVQTEFLAIKGLERMLRTVSMVSKSRKGGLKHTIVPTMYDQRTRAANEALSHLRKTYAEQTWKGVIPVDTRFREASQQATPLTVSRPGARGSRAYAHLLDWLEGKMTQWPMEMQYEESP